MKRQGFRLHPPTFFDRRKKGGVMKLHGYALVVVLALLMVGDGVAQTIRVKADVPFEFIVNGATLPPGHYSIQSFGAADGKTLLLRNADMEGNAMVNAISVESRDATQTKLVFHRYGNRYFLAQVWAAGSDYGHEFPKSHRESELAKDYSNTFQEVDVVAALR
jgi:hypothetical protein